MRYAERNRYAKIGIRCRKVLGASPKAFTDYAKLPTNMGCDEMARQMHFCEFVELRAVRYGL